MPRIISKSRKYLPALSSEDSLPSSQRSLRGRRKPAGGGPDGVAAREAEVENGDAIGEACRRDMEEQRGWSRDLDVRLNIRNGAFAAAMAVEWRRADGGEGRMKWFVTMTCSASCNCKESDWRAPNSTYRPPYTRGFAV